ncbi:hypothetical protein B0H16DRAFT_1409461 [Mycena metata]|uniref:F-box domain-containing protein n=1 Tax=Mycena metata TaxID=1033252 RepID=A0AAD7JZ10_9AGAR|nr:hypothetical protein B0H16DRAFT_1409461 [Mycena metata]
MPEVPTEILLHIASFIPKDELHNFIGVNLFFYNLALDSRYSTIRIESVDVQTHKLLQRLRDPAVAGRVRRLVVRPMLNLHRTQSAVNPSFWERIGTYVGVQTDPETPPLSIEDALVLVFPGLTNLMRFEVESWDMSPDYDLEPFFRSAWAAFGRQLETISMAGRPETFRQFVASDPQPVSCTALSLQFTHELDPMAATAVVGILVNSVAAFINSLAPHLRALKIWSWSALDLSALFNNLGHFPHLNDFHLRAPFNKALTDPTGLTRLLETNSSTLDTIELRLNPTGIAMDPNSEYLLGEWFLSHRENDLVFTGLKLLRMYPTTLRTGFNALIMYIERSANTLTTLAVKDRYLNLDEVDALITPLSHRGADQGLQALRLNVRVWNVELFDLLALKLPGLKSLSLYVGGSHPHRAATELLFAEMQTHSFAEWKLRDIGVWQGGSEVPSSTMRLLAKCFPAVQSFWRNGHMLGEGKIYE